MIATIPHEICQANCSSTVGVNSSSIELSTFELVFFRSPLDANPSASCQSQVAKGLILRRVDDEEISFNTMKSFIEDSANQDVLGTLAVTTMVRY